MLLLFLSFSFVRTFLFSSCVSGSDVTNAISHVFLHEHNSCVTPHSNTNTHNNGGRRDMHVFLARKTLIVLSLCQLKMKLLRFIIHSATKHYQASKTQHQIWRNIWSRSTVQFTEQVPPGGVEQRAASKATASTSAWGPHYPNNKSWTSVQNK